MRLIKKYKIYTKVSNLLTYPTRILKFKRTKWLRLKKIILKKQKRRRFRIRFTNKQIIRLNVGRWFNMRNVYKNIVSNNRLLITKINLDKRKLKSFENINAKKKLTSFQKFYQQITLVDQALVLNKFSSSLFLAKEQIKSKKVILNDKVLKSSVSLKKGDFLAFKDKTFNYKNIKFNQSKTYRFNTHVESDYYLQSLVVLKSKKDITNQDFYTIIGS